ncbi:hypothetical protein CC2G_002774 [Coprinopsis cinerea AmutBmut pab1-1]|nr:hypothetical protein CC2G_002774 [Coprinopsis cinerea AmutBmut pab1-1]
MSEKPGIDYDGYGFTAAGAFYGMTVQDIFIQGIMFFMCAYGLYVFLETPHHLRKGRLPYITLSLFLLINSLLNSAINTFKIFFGLYNPSSGTEFILQWDEEEWPWASILQGVLWVLYIVVADGLLEDPGKPGTNQGPNPEKKRRRRRRDLENNPDKYRQKVDSPGSVIRK